MSNKGFLIDMDGVMYRGGQMIPGADAFIRQLREDGTPFLFLTNNSQRTRRDVVTKLARMGIEVEEQQVFTCAMATARFLASQKPNGTAYVLGEGGLLNALHQNGYSVVDHDPDFVVVGEGRTLNWDMVETATQMILDGAKLIATNDDPNCPTSRGTRPGAGATIAFLEKATGRKALSIGKPSPLMMRMARKEIGLDTSDTVMIGDTMETDILGGVQMGYQTILVLSGGTRLEDIPKHPYQPDLIIDSVAKLVRKKDERVVLRTPVTVPNDSANEFVASLQRQMPNKATYLERRSRHQSVDLVFPPSLCLVEAALSGTTMAHCNSRRCRSCYSTHLPNLRTQERTSRYPQ